MKKQRTKEEKDHLSLVASLHCCVCGAHPPSSCHHIRDGLGIAQRAADEDTIPLCHYHHQGAEGFHTLGKRAWEAKYGSQRDLLADTMSRIEMLKRDL